MREWILDPVSEDEPCGPDLEKSDDDAFLDYYYDAESRLPERYFTPGLRNKSGEGTEDQLFDHSSIDYKGESAQIEALLKRSRDLRLTVLLARFMCLAGRLPEAADAVAMTADLIEKYGDDVHPAIGSSVSDRRNTLDDLGNQIHMVIPLQYCGLTPIGDVSYRKFLVATNQAEPRSGEDDLNPSKLTQALSLPPNANHVEAMHAALDTMAEALSRIKRACLGHDSHPFTPTIGDAIDTVRAIQSFIAEGRSDLPVWGEEAADEAEPAATADEMAQTQSEAVEGDAPAPDAAALTAPSGTGPAIGSHAEARAALTACEGWFVANEPSSVALLLIAQARQLIGRPLVEALETLLPGEAGKAKIDFGPETGFVMQMDRLKNLSAAALSAAPSAEADAPSPSFSVTDRGSAAALARSVEEFFARHERSSPVPVLLQKARMYLDKDFYALVTELIPTQEQPEKK